MVFDGVGVAALKIPDSKDALATKLVANASANPPDFPDTDFAKQAVFLLLGQ